MWNIAAALAAAFVATFALWDLDQSLIRRTATRSTR